MLLFEHWMVPLNASEGMVAAVLSFHRGVFLDITLDSPLITNSPMKRCFVKTTFYVIDVSVH